MEITPQLFEYFVTQGPWAVISVCLIVYVMRASREKTKLEQTSKEREEKLHELLSKFTDKYDVIIEEIKEIKNKIKH